MIDSVYWVWNDVVNNSTIFQLYVHLFHIIRFFYFTRTQLFIYEIIINFFIVNRER